MMHGAELLNIAAPVAAKIDWAQTATVVISGIVIVMLVLVVLIFIFKGFGAIMSKKRANHQKQRINRLRLLRLPQKSLRLRRLRHPLPRLLRQAALILRLWRQFRQPFPLMRAERRLP
ncbi:MAG: hypothetical protein L6V88_09970 [Anaerotruncus sp.]|nr:MAG: hypothetical protein L6V88_09970 [Anaerotruncus sp.]